MDFDIVYLVQALGPRIVVELGTGDGVAASRIIEVMRPDSCLVTINWPSPPSGDNPDRYLWKWLGDPRLTLIYGDTRDPKVAAMVPNNIDLLYVDSTHTAECATEEWRLYKPKLADTAVVVFDDLDHNDMAVFWRGLVGEKETVRCGRVGILRYRR